MNRLWRTTLMAVCILVTLAGCGETTLDDADTGGVTLSVTDFGTLQITISVDSALNGPFVPDFCVGAGLVCIDQIDVDNVPVDPAGATSSLMDVEMQSWEVSYTRGDGGTRVPPPLRQKIFGVAPVGGQQTFLNLPVMSFEQLENPPLSELLLVNGGVDQETGLSVIILNIHIRFFGRTLGGKSVNSTPASYTVEFVP
jgi:hypothetical protein